MNEQSQFKFVCHGIEVRRHFRFQVHFQLRTRNVRAEWRLKDHRMELDTGVTPRSRPAYVTLRHGSYGT